MNIPIYRAKKIDSDEYVIGNLIEDEGVFYIIKNPVVTHFNGLQQLTGECEYLDRVDPTILAINFPSWIAKDEDDNDIKVFASFNTNKIGGDIVEVRDNFVGISGVLHLDKNHDLCIDNCRITNFELSQMTVIGIQK